MDISDKDCVLNNGWKLLQIATDHHQSNRDMYDGSDFTVGDQLTDSLAGQHIAHQIKELS